MPKFAKGSDEAKEYMAMLRSRRGQNKVVAEPEPVMPVKKSVSIKPVAVKPVAKPKSAKGLLDQLTKAGTKAGQPFDTAIGLNPFTLGYDIGHDYIAPELMKVLPPKGRGRKPKSEEI